MLVAVLVTTCVLIPAAVGKVEMGKIPVDLQNMFDSFKSQTTILKTPGESIDHFCTEQYMWSTASQRWPRANFTTESFNWLVSLQPDSKELVPGKKRGKRQAFQTRIRREYRMMTEQERNNFHKAINMLKEDTLTAFPNKYEVLAELHTGVRSLAAYGGPAFFPFHRVYLYMFENALREKVPGVTLPYWDYSMDANLPNPANSIVWSPSFFGNGDGLVSSGPFADWKLTSGPLVRNVGSGGPLMTHRDVEMILGQAGLESISYPVAGLTNFEFLHAGLYRFCGGQMGTLETASQDPAFFPAHAFVDKVWEDMREQQRALGIDPETDYPVSFGAPYHGPNELMGLGQFKNIDGLNNFFSDIIRYEATPTCNRVNQDCGTPFLRCNTVSFRCEPVDVDSVYSCSTRGLNRPTQNLFSLNGRGDVEQWAYLPVKIIYSRPPEFKDYGAYPVTKGAAQYDHDIYSPVGYTATRNLARDHGSAPQGWSSCRSGTCCGGAAEVYVQSNGLNYDGFYKDNALVDQRFAISSSVTYVAVKHPMRGMSTAILRAYDSCGRMCAAACRVPGSNPERYELCNGVVTVTSGEPYMFGNNFGESLMGAWDFSANKDCPTFRENEIFMAFYCDYAPSWPFEADGRRRVNNIAPNLNVAANLGSLHDAHADHGFGGIHRVVPKGLNKCEIDSVCVINRACSGCRRGEVVKCQNGCRSFSICEYGEWTVRQCAAGQFLNPMVKKCTPGSCVLGNNGIISRQDPLTSALGMINPRLLGLAALLQKPGSTGNGNSLTSLLALVTGLRALSGGRDSRGPPPPPPPQTIYPYTAVGSPGSPISQGMPFGTRTRFDPHIQHAPPGRSFDSIEQRGMLPPGIGSHSRHPGHDDGVVSGAVDNAHSFLNARQNRGGREDANTQRGNSWLDNLLG